MDYGKVLSRAWEILWRWKVLWILGFLASLGTGGGGGGGTSYTFDSGDVERWSVEPFAPEVAGGILALIAAFGCLAILVGIAVWVVSVMARGGLIAGVQQIEDEGSTTFLQAWRVGRGKFWTLFGISILAAIPMIILGLGLVVLLILGIFGAVGMAETSDALAAGSLAGALACACSAVCGLIIVSVVLDQIRVYAERAAILEDMGWIDAFKRGWQVLKENLGPTIIFWLIFLAIAIPFILAILVVGGVFWAAMVLFGVFSRDLGPGMIVPMCCGGLLFFIVAALVNALVQTFTSTTWTLAYREFTGLAPQEVVEMTPAE